MPVMYTEQDNFKVEDRPLIRFVKRSYLGLEPLKRFRLKREDLCPEPKIQVISRR